MTKTKRDGAGFRDDAGRQLAQELDAIDRAREAELERRREYREEQAARQGRARALRTQLILGVTQGDLLGGERSAPNP